MASLWGTDLNKLAVRYAATRQRDAKFAVCQPTKLPFADGVFSVVFSVFAPSPWEEFCRVLKPGGVVIVARGGNRHLHELRSQLKDADAMRGSEAPKQFSAGLAENYLRLKSEEEYSSELASQLVEMTAWGAKKPHEAAAQREKLLQCVRSADGEASTKATVDFIVSTHRVWLGTGGEPI